MRKVKIYGSISMLVLAMLACNAVNKIVLVQTEIPAMMTAEPTMLAPVETAAAELTPSSDVPESGGTTNGLGIKLEDVRTPLESTQMFIFTDGSVDGQQAVIARLSESAATTLPGMSGDFSAAFIGDPTNLSAIKITIPATNDEATIQTGLGMMTLFFSSVLPTGVLIKFLPWISEKMGTIKAGDSEEMTASNFHFILTGTDTSVLLEILPQN